ncbi:MAG: hypothetical protein DRQ56_09055 [Gammaproteobacteria bacterium]|nr:MAG: hypothetical protein DRQ56_09055 [Gammaproteobacteria bacterium]
MDKHIIVGVHIVDREAHAPKVQEVFTKYGAQINTRLGLHDSVCASNGLILLEMADTPETCRLIEEIGSFEGVDCQTMMFEH